jgi:hypothetical protein
VTHPSSFPNIFLLQSLLADFGFQGGTMSKKTMRRREVIAALGAAGTAIAFGCSNESPTSPSIGGGTGSTTGTNAACAVTPTETAGPFPSGAHPRRVRRAWHQPDVERIGRHLRRQPVIGTGYAVGRSRIRICGDLSNRRRPLVDTALRRKIEADPQDPELILTAWGVGYKFADVP